MLLDTVLHKPWLITRKRLLMITGSYPKNVTKRPLTCIVLAANLIPNWRLYPYQMAVQLMLYFTIAWGKLRHAAIFSSNQGIEAHVPIHTVLRWNTRPALVVITFGRSIPSWGFPRQRVPRKRQALQEWLPPLLKASFKYTRICFLGTGENEQPL